MARILGLFPSALAAARGGMTERAWEQQVRSLGLGARSSEMLQLWRVAKSITVASPDEPFRPPELVPRGDDLRPWPTNKATGIAQNISITYRDKTTGKIKQTFYRVVTPGGITREAATAQAIDAYSDAAERYGQELIGAVHTSAYLLSPGIV